MQQVKVSVSQSQLTFLNSHQALGYKDRSAMVRAALEKMQADYEQRVLRESADLYAEIYKIDADVRYLVDSAEAEWPE